MEMKPLKCKGEHSQRQVSHNSEDVEAGERSTVVSVGDRDGFQCLSMGKGAKETTFH